MTFGFAATNRLNSFVVRQSHLAKNSIHLDCRISTEMLLPSHHAVLARDTCRCFFFCVELYRCFTCNFIVPSVKFNERNFLIRIFFSSPFLLPSVGSKWKTNIIIRNPTQDPICILLSLTVDGVQCTSPLAAFEYKSDMFRRLITILQRTTYALRSTRHALVCNLCNAGASCTRSTIESFRELDNLATFHRNEIESKMEYEKHRSNLSAPHSQSGIK